LRQKTSEKSLTGQKKKNRDYDHFYNGSTQTVVKYILNTFQM